MTRCLVLRVPKDTWGSWPLCYTPQACVVLPILSLLTKQPGRVKLLPAEAAWLVLSRTSLQFRRDHDSITVCTKNKTPGSHSPAWHAIRCGFLTIACDNARLNAFASYLLTHAKTCSSQRPYDFREVHSAVLRVMDLALDVTAATTTSITHISLPSVVENCLISCAL